jgi:hypothetical protein
MEAPRGLERRLARVVFTLLQPSDDTAAAPLPQAAWHRSNAWLEH